jgi:hypothetical protein
VVETPELRIGENVSADAPHKRDGKSELTFRVNSLACKESEIRGISPARKSSLTL